jgi:hypothetical protein
MKYNGLTTSLPTGSNCYGVNDAGSWAEWWSEGGYGAHNGSIRTSFLPVLGRLSTEQHF